MAAPHAYCAARMQSRWSDAEAREYVERLGPRWGEDLALRVYTSRLIGRDPDLVMHGGGNTSLKGTLTTLVGERVEALFVKGAVGISTRSSRRGCQPSTSRICASSAPSPSCRMRRW